MGRVAKGELVVAEVKPELVDAIIKAKEAVKSYQIAYYRERHIEKFACLKRCDNEYQSMTQAIDTVIRLSELQRYHSGFHNQLSPWSAPGGMGRTSETNPGLLDNKDGKFIHVGSIWNHNQESYWYLPSGITGVPGFELGWSNTAKYSQQRPEHTLTAYLMEMVRLELGIMDRC